VTEIPEHLLKRSKERRAAIGGEDAPADEAAPAAEAAPPAAPAAPAAPAVPATAAAAEVAPAPPEPVRPEVAAARNRKKVPFWALPVLVGLPLWAYVYAGTLEPPPAADDDPVTLGEAVYSSCAACHGGDGGGVGSFPALTAVLETWPDYRDHMAWVRLGSAEWPGDTYGATDEPKDGGMPPHPQLTDEELAQVVLYERVAFGGLEEGSEEYLALEAIAHGDEAFADGGLGELSAEAGVEESALEGG
jgi:mono/diheme cytochrome c family protein